MATKKIKVTKKVERKTFIKGNFEGRYYGDIDDQKSFSNATKYYDIHVYEAEIKNIQVIEETIYERVDSEIHFFQKHFENVVSIIDEKAVDFDAFRLKINEPKGESIVIKDVIKEDPKTFGTLVCVIYGYLVDVIDKEEVIDVEVCDNCNAALEVCDCKSSSYEVLGVCEQEPKPVPILPKPYPIVHGCLDAIRWLVLIGFGVLFFASVGLPGIIVTALLIGLYFLFNYFSKLAEMAISIFSWFFRLAFGLLFLSFLVSLISGVFSVATNTSKRAEIKPKVIENPEEEKGQSRKLGDTAILISHKRLWRDYDNHLYSGNLSILEKDFKQSRLHRNEVSFNLYNDYQWSLLYSSLIQNDKDKLEYVYNTFDSIGKANKLNKKQFAEMVVSCIQDVPYALVVQRGCNKDLYGDSSIKEQLERCPECCIGDIKYGIQAPAEFTANLKGDCDTRTVMLFAILSKFGYNVAVLGSLSYQHSIIAINLPYSGSYKEIKGGKYYVWETTATGFQPGILSPKLSNMDLWNVHLITNN